MRMREFFYKTLVASFTLLSLLFSAQAFAASLSMSQVPLFLTEGVAPNIMVTIDNSGSMRWAFAPDDLNPSSGTYGGYTADQVRTSRRAKSSMFNALYYNPDVTYTAPYSVTYNAGEVAYTPLTSSFTAAYVNGFKSTAGSYNLSSNYRVTWEYDTERTTSTSSFESYTKYSNYGYYVYWLAANPTSDYGSSSSSSSSVGATTTTTGVSYPSSSTCPSTINSSSYSGSSTSTSSTDANTGATITTSSTVTTTTSYSNIVCGTKSAGKYPITVTTTSTPTITTTVTRADKTSSAVPAYYYVYDSGLSNCDGTLHDDDCYSRVVVSATSGPDASDERQNFANWFSFYRNRALATQSAANLAFATLSESTRLSWQALGTSDTCISSKSYLSSYNCRGLTNSSTSYYDNRLGTFSGAHRAKFFEWLGDIYYNQSTPLLEAVDRAGASLATTGNYSPYAYAIGSSEAPLYACRASYSITLTDGIWNTAGSHGEYDNATQTLPDQQSYSPLAPFKDSTGNTLADLAFKYWATDAQTAIDNEVPSYTQETSSNATTQYWNPKNNPATWQHMVSFFVGLGLTSSLTNPAWGGDTYAGDYSSLVAGSKSWPAASASSSNNVYDLWHAALNSRGEFFSVDSPGDLVMALEEVVNRISEQTSTAASPAVTSPLLDSDGSNTYDTYTYTPKFSSEDWSGDLLKYEQDTVAGTQEQVWSAQTLLDTAYGDGNSAYSARQIKIANSAGNLQDFTWSNLSSEQQASLNRALDASIDTYGASRVDYLRGDRRNEGSLFRSRDHILGDIVDSTPIIVRKPSRLASRMDATELQNSTDSNSYTQFKSAQANRETRIYVGANDGMLHAFNEAGEETFAFIPTEVIGNLYKLTDKDYVSSSHQYYVDGSPAEADVYFAGAWHSVVIGSLRGGGRSLFALDVTDPDNVTLLWEISAADSDYAQLGFTYAKPSVTRLSNGTWAVVAGNGYNSDADAAVLYLIDVADGSLIKSFTVDDDSSTSNGLATPYVADLDGDLIAEYAYAGDLHGNLWRFDLQGANSSAYGIAFGAEPLYSAISSTATAQPITSRPYLAKHTSGVGYIVMFGTGKYLESSDADPNTAEAMSIYGIWDAEASVGAESSSVPSLTRSNLVQQTIDAESVTSFDNNGTAVTSSARTLSNNAVDWFDEDGNVDRYGWYLDLKMGSTLEGEMVVNSPYVSDDLLIISTLTPNEDPCADGVTTWLLTLDPNTGGSTGFASLDLNNDGVIDTQDNYQGTTLSGTEMPGLTGGFTSTRDATGNIVICGSDSCETLSGSANAAGRQSWRTIQTKE
ncbi:MAG: pilus assembly protein PilY [Pseudomonadales bacterium]|nr:pilus assembly protein PilY [Pseudomonadales bacterium]